MEIKKRINVEIGSRLRSVRENLNQSQEEFAESLELTSGHYRKIEAGEYALSIFRVSVLHEIYGLDPTYLILGDKSEFLLEQQLINCTRKEKQKLLKCSLECIAKQMDSY